MAPLRSETPSLRSRQKVPQLNTEAFHGDGPVAVEIVATGSEVSLAAEVADALRADGYGVRVVSALDRSRYIPDPSATTVSIEAGTTGGWAGLVDLAIGIDEFGASGPGDEVMAHYGFTADAVLARIRAYLENR
jgi:transketolase